MWGLSNSFGLNQRSIVMGKSMVLRRGVSHISYQHWWPVLPKLEYKIIDNNTSSKLQCQLQKGEEEINIYNGYSVKLIMKMMSFLKNIKLNQSSKQRREDKRRCLGWHLWIDPPDWLRNLLQILLLNSFFSL